MPCANPKAAVVIGGDPDEDEEGYMIQGSLHVESDPRHTGAHYNLALAYEKVDVREAVVQWERYIELASQIASEKEWVDVARQHLRKLREKEKSQ